MSDCCAIAKPEPAATENCPGCGRKGRPVGFATVQAIVKPELAPSRGGETNRFCPNPTCDHLYFDGEWVARKSDARVRVGLKESSDPLPVCYCFGFTRADVRAEVQATGKCTIPDRITAEVQAGNCACETKNPSGTCCLGEVRKAVKEALASAARSDTEIGGSP
ncbi:MAG: copper chaperone Copz family protein [Deltaproteobacteria bacterium]|nr:copper chaperone Copz family protein [Deltaproteobacteria bacterium]